MQSVPLQTSFCTAEAIYARLRDLLTNSDQRVYVFAGNRKGYPLRIYMQKTTLQAG